MTKTLFIWIAIALLGANSLRAATEQPPADASAAADYRAVLNRYCVTCHNEKLRTAELTLDKMDVDRVGENAPVWEKVVRKLRTRAMPPAGAPRPDNAFYDSFAAYLETELDRAASAKPNPGRPAAHRLNRAEYANAIRDLLAVEIDGAALLPADDAGHGFDNSADTLSVSPLLVEKYVSAAGKISRLAIGDSAIRPYTESHDVSRRLMQDDRVSEDLPFGSRGGIAARHNFPVDGEYVLKVRLQRNNDNYIRGLNEPHQIDVRLDGARIKLFTIGGENKARSGPLYTFINAEYRGDAEQEKYETAADSILEVRFPAKAGARLIQVAFLNETMEPEAP
jgi:mono/diheme cytochrome c family protein